MSALSQEFEGPKSSTNPLEEEECDGPKGGGDEEKAALDDESDDCGAFWEFEIELGCSLLGLLVCCVSLLALVSGFVEQRRKDGNFEEIGERVVELLGLEEHAHEGIKVVGGVKRWKIETFERLVLRGCNEGSAIDDAIMSMAVERFCTRNTSLRAK